MAKLLPFSMWAVAISTLFPFIYGNSEYRTVAYFISVSTILLTAIIQLLLTTTRKIVIQTIRQSLHVHLFFVVFILSQFATIATSDPGRTEAMDIAWLAGYVVIGAISYFIFAAAVANTLFKSILLFFITIGVLSSIIAIYVAITGAKNFFIWEIQQVSYYRAFGVYFSSSLFYTANRFAFVAFWGCVGSLYFFLTSKHRSFFATCLLLCVIGILLSWSRAMYIALFLSGFTWIFINVRPKYRVWIAVGIALIMLITLSILFSVEAISTMVFVQGWARRDEIWPAAIQAISYHPWAGYGISSGDAVKELLYHYTGQLDAVHSTPLSLAFRAGIPTAVLWFIVFSMSFIRLAYSQLNQADKSVVVMGLVGTFVACMFTDYSIGGAGYGSLVSTIFLGLANVTPFLQPRQQTKPVLS